MRTILLTIITSLLFTKIQAQIIEASKLQIGINFSPDGCYRLMEENEFTSKNGFKDLMDKNETFKLGFTTGVNVYYQFNRMFGLETGVQYANRGFQTKKSDFFLLSVDPLMSVNVRTKYIYKYLDIPLKVNYTYGNGKIKYIAGFGVINSFILVAQRKTVGYYNDKGSRMGTKEQISESTNPFVLSPTVSFGADYRLNNKINFRIEPNIKFAIMSAHNKLSFNQYLYSAGLNFSVLYRLK